MKKIKRIIPIIFVLTLLLSTYVFAHNSVFTKQTGLIELTYQELKTEDLTNNFLVFSREDCPHCVDFYEGLDKIIEEDPELLVFYVDTNKLSQAEKDDIRESYEVYYVPTFLYVTKENQKVVYFGENDYASIKEFISENSKQQFSKKRLRRKL